MIAVLLALLAALAGGGPSDLQRAAEAYRSGRYEEALVRFEAALGQAGVSDGAVLYDMGNCAYRLGRPVDAVVLYRRALRRLPGDPEATFNLGLAERRLGVRPEVDSGGRVAAWLDALSPGALLALATALQGIGLCGVMLRRGRRAAPWGMAGLLVLGLVVGLRAVRGGWGFEVPDGVVVAREIALRVEPHREMPVAVRLRAGETVRVEEASARWARVVHARGGGLDRAVGHRRRGLTSAREGPRHPA